MRVELILLNLYVVITGIKAYNITYINKFERLPWMIKRNTQ